MLKHMCSFFADFSHLLFVKLPDDKIVQDLSFKGGLAGSFHFFLFSYKVVSF